jgi:hypothetical protein
MPRSDAFAFKNSGLNAFLFAEVGNEVNGSPLTILSVFARLGQDPWAEAARLARLPKAAIIDYLANSISQMPLCPQALTDARTTAARIIQLLPSQRNSGNATVATSSIPRWLPLALLFAAIAFGIAFEMSPPATPANAPAPLTGPLMAPPPAPAADAVPKSDQPSGQPGSPHVSQ